MTEPSTPSADVLALIDSVRVDLTQPDQKMVEVDHEKLAALLRSLAQGDVRNAVIEECAKQVPTTWLDPLLTGKTAVLPATGDWNGRHMEALLRGIQDRIRALAAEQPERKAQS